MAVIKVPLHLLLHLTAPFFFLLLLLPTRTTGAHEYANSYISPNSAKEDHLISQEMQHHVTSTSGPSEIRSSESQTVIENLSSVSITFPDEDPRHSKTKIFDDILINDYKNIDHIDSNDVELSGRLVQFIQPSKTVDRDSNGGSSGEDRGAPKGRSVPLEPLQINPTATMMKEDFVTQSHQPRQVNPDIQDIITGLVKLLNGKVNVQANTALPPGRPPIRPLSSRINNRGPPRITDVPALPPDFDLPPPPPLTQMTPPATKLPTPYPFDIPPQNTSPVIRPFPMDKIIPVGSNKGRPPLYRPVTIPPWNRLPPRRPPPPNRRPPTYKPIPPRPNLSNDDISITSEKPDEDILNFDIGTELDGSEGDKEEEDSTEIIPEFEPEKDDNRTEIADHKDTLNHQVDEINNITNVVETTTIKINKNETKFTTEEPFINDTTTIEPSSVENATKLMLDDRLNETSSSPEPILILESSMQDVLQTTMKSELQSSSSSLSSIPTESLPLITSLVSSSETPSIQLETFSSTSLTHTSNQTESTSSYPSYKPRPGIVLDDTEFRPGRNPLATSRPHPHPHIHQPGDIFDVTVSAIQGPSGQGQGKPYVIPVDIESINLGSPSDVILTSQDGQGFVSIDGKRTYLNLFGEPTSSRTVIHPTQASSNSITGTGYAVVDVDKKPEGVHHNIKPTPRRPSGYSRRPSQQPPVRIDTCIVGDDSTCDGSQHEICRTEVGVSACYCRPGHARRKHREPCRKVVSVLLSLRVDRLYERRVVWANDFSDKSSVSFQKLSYETEKALESAMSMTRFSDEFLNAKVNSIYKGDRSAGQGGVFVNLTLQLEENGETSRPQVRGEIQKHLLGVIQRRSNNVGDSALWVDSPPGSVSNLQDLDECSSPDLHDCHSHAKCVNTFGGFKCECNEGFRDPWSDNRHRAGRYCEQCSPQHCNNRGECKYQNGQEFCVCSGNYYGTQCELDGEVLGVAIGASVAAVVIIGLTLICLVMWTRRWSKEQKTGVGSPVFGYMGANGSTIKAPPVGAPPYQLTMEDRLRWAQIADAMAQANHYAPEPVMNGPTRPSSAVFGYPTLPVHGTLQHGSMHGTLPPIPLPRLGLQAQLAARAASVQGMRPLDNSSSSEEEDKTDLLGRNFQVPRPKSRSNASIASGIYYDVDYDQNDIYSKTGMPMSTYAIGRPYFRN
ncbi:uncharacterized protein [Onthophagus taurus]|uniref:uncharacterized protein n=1 Tax=Onthophagus taurus TaxID=166361 RepID=UPI0039BE735D